MKKFTKLFLSCAAVAAVTAAVATSAMAAPVEVKGEATGTYDNQTGALSVTLPEKYNAANEQQTLLVIGPATGETKADKTNITADVILGIDQQATAEGKTAITAKLDTNKVKTDDNQYMVLLGGTAGKVYVATFGAGGVLVGDVDLNEDIDLDDATEIVKHAVKISTLTGDALVAADTDFNDDVDLDDATCIVKYAVKLSEGTGHVGETK